MLQQNGGNTSDQVPNKNLPSDKKTNGSHEMTVNPLPHKRLSNSDSVCPVDKKRNKLTTKESVESLHAMSDCKGNETVEEAHHKRLGSKSTNGNTRQDQRINANSSNISDSVVGARTVNITYHNYNYNCSSHQPNARLGAESTNGNARPDQSPYGCSEDTVRIQSLASNLSSDQDSEQAEYPLFAKLKDALCACNWRFAVKDNVFSCKEIQNICPKMYKVPDYYETGLGKCADSYQPSNSNSCHSSPDFSYGTTQIEFDELLQQTSEKNYSAIIGPPGCGKTVCSLRLALSQKYLCFFNKFVNINYSTPLTLKQFTVDFRLADGSWSDEEKEEAFKFILSHAEKCMFVLDGYDQSVPKLETPTMLDYNTPMSISNLLGSLSQGHLLPGAKFILTSRPFAINDLPSDLQPNLVIYMQELHKDDVKILFKYHSKDDENASQVWDLIESQSPLLLDLCQNALMLKLCVKAALVDRTAKFKDVHTMTDMFCKLLQCFRRSQHAGKRITPELFQKLSQLAFLMTRRKTVVVTKDYLEKVKLQDENVQDLIISVVGDVEEVLFEGDELMLFVHQTWQEIFAAYYCCQMPMDKFRVFSEQFLTTPSWCMVRRFLCGMLLGSPKSVMSDHGLKRRKKILLNQLVEDFQDEHKRLEVMIDLLEIEEKYVKVFAKVFPSKADFSSMNLGTSGFYALSKIIKYTNGEIEILDLRNTYPSKSSLSYLCKSMQKTKSVVKDLDLSFNYLKDEHVPVLKRIIPLVKERLQLCGAFTHSTNKNKMVQPNLQQQQELGLTRDKRNPSLKILRCSSAAF